MIAPLRLLTRVASWTAYMVSFHVADNTNVGPGPERVAVSDAVAMPHDELACDSDAADDMAGLGALFLDEE